MRGCILVVDDEAAIREVVRLNLESEGYEVVSAEDAEAALRAFETCTVVLAILDVMLPDTDGFELARTLRERSDIPIIMLLARDSDVDKAVGLGIGADDYVTKPFSPMELVARVKAHLRRYAGAGGSVVSTDEVIIVGPVRIDAASRRVMVRGVAVELTAKEFDILHLLVEQPGRVFTKAQIYERVWGEEPIGDLGTVQVHVRRLRMKLEENPEDPTLVTTVWGIGYRFEGGR